MSRRSHVMVVLAALSLIADGRTGTCATSSRVIKDYRTPALDSTHPEALDGWGFDY